jgi:hypothetical protein
VAILDFLRSYPKVEGSGVVLRYKQTRVFLEVSHWQISFVDLNHERIGTGAL